MEGLEATDAAEEMKVGIEESGGGERGDDKVEGGVIIEDSAEIAYSSESDDGVSGIALV